MNKEQAKAMAAELGVILNVLHNGFQFKRGNQIVTLYKRKWHYNLGTQGEQWKNFNGDHVQVLRNIFKMPVQNKLVTDPNAGIDACIDHVKRKICTYKEVKQGKASNETLVMMQNLIHEFEQYRVDNKTIVDIKLSTKPNVADYSIQKAMYQVIEGNGNLEQAIEMPKGFTALYAEDKKEPVAMSPYCQVGTIVALLQPVLGQPVGTLGIAYNVWEGGTASIISDEGVDFGGFHSDEIPEYLEFIKHSNLQYEFISVIRLQEDFRQGRFDQYFKS